MVEPEIYEFLDWVSEVAESLGLVVLPEVHDRYPTHERLAAPRVLDLRLRPAGPRPARVRDRSSRSGSRRTSPHRPTASSRRSTATTGSRSAPTSTASSSPTRCSTSPTGRAPGRQRQPDPVRRRTPTGVDVHQLNCTYYSALGGDDERYLAARAIQLFAQGVPQVYYVGLLAGRNDVDAVGPDGRGPRDQPP